MIKKIINDLIVSPIQSTFFNYTKKDISCAWCFKKQSIYINLKTDHICSYCGKTFYVKNNREFKV